MAVSGDFLTLSVPSFCNFVLTILLLIDIKTQTEEDGQKRKTYINKFILGRNLPILSNQNER